MPEKELEGKTDRLRGILADMERVAVCYSGGVDSTFLLKIARDTLGDNVAAMTAVGPLHPYFETQSARETAKQMGVPHVEIENIVDQDSRFAANPPNRCYLCKRVLLTALIRKAREMHIQHVVEGSNLDDLNDFRPGRKASEELGVRSPLLEAKFTKADIRQASRDLGLPTWDRPSLACYASRFPYGTRIDRALLRQVAQAEDALRNAGFTQVRVRYHGPVARIEVPPEQIRRLMDAPLREPIVEKILEAGFTYVTLDLAGYRTGSMNEELMRQEE